MSKRVVLVYPRIIKGWQALSRVEIPMVSSVLRLP